METKEASSALGINTLLNAISKPHRDKQQRFVKSKAWEIEEVLKEVMLNYSWCEITTKQSKWKGMRNGDKSARTIFKGTWR